MDVRMPDGVIVKNVPDGITQEELLSLYGSSKGGEAAPAAPAAEPGAFDNVLNSLRNPQTGGRGGVVGPMMLGGAGELIKGAGALTQLGFPETGTNMVNFGQAMTEGAKSVSPVSATTGQIASYLAPFSAAQKVGGAIVEAPAIAKAIGGIPSFIRSTFGQGGTGAALGYGLTPDSENRGSAALFGLGTGAATPTLGKLAGMLRGKINPNVQGGVDEAVDAGYTIPPSQVNNSIIGRALEGLSGKSATAQNASALNQDVTNRLSNKALGLADDTFLTLDGLKGVRKEAGKAYDAIENVGIIKPGKEYFAELNKIKEPFVKIAGSFPDQAPSPVIKFVDSLKSDAFDASAAIANIRQLRTMADDAFTKGEKDLSTAYKKSAGAMEDAIEAHLAKQNQTELLKDFRDARKLIAKTYTVEKAINPAGGNVDARKIAGQLKKKPLDEELKTVGEFAARFPKAAQTTEQMGSLPQVSPLDFLAAGGIGSAGYAVNNMGEGSEAGTIPMAIAAILASRPAARAALTSKTGQKMLLQGETSKRSADLAKALIMQGGTKLGAGQDQ